MSDVCSHFPIVGGGEAAQIVALCAAIDAIAASIDLELDRAVDPLRKDLAGIHRMFETVTAEIRERVDAWLAVEQSIATGEFERCADCGDVHQSGERMADHRAHFHPEAAR